MISRESQMHVGSDRIALEVWFGDPSSSGVGGGALGRSYSGAWGEVGDEVGEPEEEELEMEARRALGEDGDGDRLSSEGGIRAGRDRAWKWMG